MRRAYSSYLLRHNFDLLGQRNGMDSVALNVPRSLSHWSECTIPTITCDWLIMLATRKVWWPVIRFCKWVLFQWHLAFNQFQISSSHSVLNYPRLTVPGLWFESSFCSLGRPKRRTNATLSSKVPCREITGINRISQHFGFPKWLANRSRVPMPKATQSAFKLLQDKPIQQPLCLQ